MSASSFAAETRRRRTFAIISHPDAGKTTLTEKPLRLERVCEVKYDHLQGDRFRHATQFLRWRDDKRPEKCRYDQLEVTTPFELDRVFGAGKK